MEARSRFRMATAWSPRSTAMPLKQLRADGPCTHPGTGILASLRTFEQYGGEWPPHCVQGTEGAAFHDDLRLP